MKSSKDSFIDLDVYDQKAEKVRTVGVHSDFLKGKIYPFLVTEIIRMYRLSQRQGNASSKLRSEVVGSGVKPWKQKGTGRARAGSRKSPIWRGGGVTFGPKPRDYSFSMPKKMKRRALLSVLRDRFSEGNILLLDSCEMSSPKTSEICKIFKVLKIDGKILLVDEKNTQNLLFATANLKDVSVKESSIVNALDVLSAKMLVCTEAGLLNLQDRLYLSERKSS